MVNGWVVSGEWRGKETIILIDNENIFQYSYN